MRRLKLALLLGSLAFVPVVFLPQWLGIMTGAPGWVKAVNVSSSLYQQRDAYQTAPWRLFIREFLPLAFTCLVLATDRSFWRLRALLPVLCLFLLYSVSLAVLMLGEFRTLLLGAGAIALIRTLVFFLLPLAVSAFLVHRDSRRYLRIVFSFVVLLLAFNLLVSVAQNRWGSGVEMLSVFGPRPIGIATNPNVAGTLMGIGALLLLYHWRPWGVWLAIFPAVVVGAILTGSRTAMIGTLLVAVSAVWTSRQRGRMALSVLLLPGAVVLLLNVNHLSGREDAILARGGIAGDSRVTVLLDTVSRMSAVELFGGYGSGFGTNVGSRVATAAVGGGIVPATDSLVTTTVLQFGLVGSAIFACAVLVYFILLVPSRAGLVFLLFFGIFGGATQNIIEAYPAGLLFGVLLGCWVAKERLQRMTAGLLMDTAITA